MTPLEIAFGIVGAITAVTIAYHNLRKWLRGEFAEFEARLKRAEVDISHNKANATAVANSQSGKIEDHAKSIARLEVQAANHDDAMKEVKAEIRQGFDKIEKMLRAEIRDLREGRLKD